MFTIYMLIFLATDRKWIDILMMGDYPFFEKRIEFWNKFKISLNKNIKPIRTK